MKDTIVVFSGNTENWGAERSVCSMCDILKQRGAYVLVVLPKEGPIINLLDKIQVDYVVLPFSMWIYSSINALRPDRYIRNVFRIINSARRIKNEILKRGYRPILVYSSTILFGTGIYCASKWNVPHIHHFRENIDAFGYKFIFGNRFTMHYLSSYTDQIICTCNAVKQRYVQYIKDVKMDVVNNGVPVIEKINCSSSFDKIRFIQVGRFMNDKRIIDSLCAINMLVNDGCVNLKFDIYGKGPEESLYRDFIINNHLEEYIEIKGFCQNIPFQDYHVGLMTSTFEAFARTTLDYMNNGLAVVASNTGGNLEQVQDGQTGLLYEVHSANSLAMSLRYLYDHPTIIQELGSNGRKRFLEKYTEGIYQRKIGDLIMSHI